MQNNSETPIKNEWDARYAVQDHLYGRDANVFIQQIAQKMAFSGNTLGLAESEGRNLLYLADLAKQQQHPFCAELWDYAQVALDKAQRHAVERDITLHTHKVDLTQADQYDNIICVFGHFDAVTRQQVLQGVRNSLVDGGWFIGEVYSTEQLAYQTGGPRVKAMLYDPIEFLSHFQHDHIQHFFVGEVERFEGQLHHGLSHVIQFAIQIRKSAVSQ
ncbi:class I SAM-dependent methyltransferase [Acinetobacter tandoii]|uniref:class I SAM-dependent methyltransferase n=1 Tax=Acinetobacter tandoii TaxID=202954 RepID=UPI004045EE00